jgi:hypothetical protein
MCKLVREIYMIGNMAAISKVKTLMQLLISSVKTKMWKFESRTTYIVNITSIGKHNINVIYLSLSYL